MILVRPAGSFGGASGATAPPDHAGAGRDASASTVSGEQALGFEMIVAGARPSLTTENRAPWAWRG